MKIKKYISLILVLASFQLLISGCTSPISHTYLATQNPGDVWSWTLNGDGTFSATNEENTYTYSGDIDTLSSGFLKFTILATTDPGASVGDIAYGFEVPNTALVVKPAGSTDAIFGVALGDCPSSGTVHANTIDIPHPGWDHTLNHAYSQITATVTGSNIDVTSDKYYLNGTFNSTEDSLGLTCSDGRITKPASTSTAVMTPSRGFLVDNGSGNGGNFGTYAPATDVAFSDILATGREYRGLLYKDINTGTETTELIWARPDGSGDLLGGEYVDVEANTESTSGATIHFVSQPSPGIIRATKTDTSGTTDILFVVNKIGYKYMLYGISVSSGTALPEVFIAMEL